MRKTSAVFGLLACMVASRALAQDKSTQADQRFDEGMAYFKKSDFDNARQSFVQAYALVAKTRYLWNLSIAEYKSGHPADALNHWHAYFRSNEVEKGDPQKASALMTEAAKQSLQLRIVATAGARVLVDGVLLHDEAPLPDPLALVPGKHHVTARLVDQEKSVDVEGAAGESKEVAVVFEPAKPITTLPIPSGAPPVATTPNVTRTETYRSTAATIAPVMVGVLGLVGVGAGFGFGAASDGAASDANTLSSRLGRSACTGVASADCTLLSDNRSSQSTFHTASSVFFVVGPVLVVSAVVLALAWPKSTRTVTALSNGLQLHF